jgi:predicted metalloprotease with PDZ domain
MRLPSDYYGTPRLYEFVHDIVVSDGVEMKEGERPTLRVLTHEPGAEITFSYTMAFDPAERPNCAFRPSVGPAHFHFLGPQWLARIEGEDDRIHDFTFRFADVPEDWQVFASFGVGVGPHHMRASWDDLITTVLGGGDYRHDAFDVHGRPVHTFVYGPFRADDQEVFDSVRKIVTFQRDFFEDYEHDLLVVTLTTRPRLAAGTSVRNAMICYADATRPLSEIQLLLAHEMFHQWLPGQGEIDPGDFSERFDWFNEGFTEYFARRLLLDQGLTDIDRYVAYFNRDLRELARNPYREMTMDDIRGVHEREEFTGKHYRLSYLRGALVALDWNARMVEASDGQRSLIDCMRQFMERAQAEGGKLASDRFHQLLDEYGIDSRDDIERWFNRAEPIEPAAHTFGPAYELKILAVPDPAFDRETAERRGTLSSVDPDGPAYAAGLRNGMPFLSLVDEPDGDGSIIVTVRVDDQQREYRYQPASRDPIPQFVRREP